MVVSGLSGNKEVAQEQVLIGMGLLAGSTVMLLTVLWGSCVIVGKCDLSEDNKTAIDLQNNKKFSLCGMYLSVIYFLKLILLSLCSCSYLFLFCRIGCNY